MYEAGKQADPVNGVQEIFSGAVLLLQADQGGCDDRQGKEGSQEERVFLGALREPTADMNERHKHASLYPSNNLLSPCKDLQRPRKPCCAWHTHLTPIDRARGNMRQLELGAPSTIAERQQLVYGSLDTTCKHAPLQQPPLCLRLLVGPPTSRPFIEPETTRDSWSLEPPALLLIGSSSSMAAAEAPLAPADGFRLCALSSALWGLWGLPERSAGLLPAELPVTLPSCSRDKRGGMQKTPIMKVCDTGFLAHVSQTLMHVEGLGSRM